MAPIKTFLLAALLGFFGHSKGQFSPRFEDLAFHSDFEKKAFEDLEPLSPERFLALLMAASPFNEKSDLAKAEAFLSQIFADLEAEGVRKKSVKKASKIIFERAHSRLAKYERNVPFHLVYRNGVYNCVTATALYALILERFGIEYEVREHPLHVNLFVDPRGENIKFEATDPEGGFQVIDKERTVRELRRSKLISSAEMTGRTAAEVYDEFFAEEAAVINLRQLAAIHYSNMAVLAMEKDDFGRARRLTEKAIFLQDEPLRQTTRMRLVALLADELKHEKPSDLEPIFELLKYPKLRSVPESNLPLFFEKLSNECLIETADTARLEAFFAYFRSKLQAEPALFEKIRYARHVQWARHFWFKKQPGRELLHLDSAFALRPADLQLQGMIIESAIADLFKDFENPDPKKADALTRRFPFLADAPEFKKAILAQDMLLLSLHFHNNRAAEGFAVFEKIEPQLLVFLAENSMAEELVGRTFGEIFRYFVRQSDYAAADDWLKKGLLLSPNNSLLTRDREMLEQHLMIYGDDKKGAGGKKKVKN